MTQLAVAWLVYRLSHSALMLGVVGFASQIASFLLSPAIGAAVEGFDRRTLLVATQSIAAGITTLLAILTINGSISLSAILLFSLVQGVLNAVDMPARQSFFVQVVHDPADLGNAIALNSVLVNGARLAGPALAGFVVARVGEGYCFLIDGISYLAVIACLARMRIRTNSRSSSDKSVIVRMRSGWHYISTHRPIRDLLIVVASVSLTGSAYGTLLPLLAGGLYGGWPRTLGLLSAAAGGGALISALSLSLRKSAIGLPEMIWLALTILGIALIVLGAPTLFSVAVVSLILVGFGLLQCAAACNTLIQSLVKEQLRARTMSYFTMAFSGMAPFGALLVGGLAHFVGLPVTFVLIGSVCLITALWFALRKKEIERALRSVTS